MDDCRNVAAEQQRQGCKCGSRCKVRRTYNLDDVVAFFLAQEVLVQEGPEEEQQYSKEHERQCMDTRQRMGRERNMEKGSRSTGASHTDRLGKCHIGTAHACHARLRHQGAAGSTAYCRTSAEWQPQKDR